MQNFSLKKFVISKITTNFAVSYYKTKCLTVGNSTIFRNNEHKTIYRNRID